jgi:hypothetical protein
MSARALMRTATGTLRLQKLQTNSAPTTAAATHASRTRNVKPNLEATRFDRSHD